MGLTKAIDKNSIYPIGLPDKSKSYVLSDAKSAGWKIYSENLLHPVLQDGFFSKPATYSVTEIPVVVDMKVSSCRAFAGRGEGILVPANGSICLSRLTSTLSAGDPVVAKSADGDYVLIGVGQSSMLAGKEHFQETASRFSCFIQWVADYYNLQAASSGHILSWSTACPAQEDIAWGSTGSVIAGIPGAKFIESPRNKVKNKKSKHSDKTSNKEKKKQKIIFPKKPKTLQNYPGCGKSIEVDGKELFPWQGSLVAVHTETKEEKFIAPVALLSITSTEYPNHPTILISSGGVIDPYKFDLVLDKVKLLGGNEVTAKDFKEMGFEVEVRFSKSNLRKPAVKKGLFKSSESYTWAKSPVVSHFEVESCAVVTGRAMGGFYTIANGSLCLDSADNRVSWGDLVMIPNSAGKLSLVGIGQHSAKDYIRSRQETATRLSCYLHWVAEQFGMDGISSEHQATWSTGCPKVGDIKVGAPGVIATNDGNTKEKEQGRSNKKGGKGNSRKNNKTKKQTIIFKDSDHNVEISLE